MITYSIIQKSQLESAKRLDAEYYQPEFLSNVEKLKNFGFHTLEEMSITDITKGETPLWRGDDYLSLGIPFLRSENLISSGLDLSNIVFVSEKVHERMKRSKIYPNDILIAIVGATIGQIGLVTDDYKEYNSNQALAIVRPTDKKYSHYLSIVLETKFCQLQIERLKGGGARDNLDLHEVKVIKIPKATNKILDYCSNIVEEIKNLQNQSKISYSQAEKLLLEKLELKDYKIDDELSCIVNFFEAKNVHRIDAEYFQPKYKKLELRIKNQELRKLGELVSMKKGIEPGADAYQDEGKLFIRVSSISKQGLIDKDQKYLSDVLYNELRKNYEPKQDEILLTKDATPGTAYVLKEKVEGIVSSGIMRLKLKEDIETEYLALCVNSLVGKMQIERDSGGSIIEHWKPEQIKNLQIPVLPRPIQQKIADLVHKSHESRKKAKELLSEAKQKVEKIISGEKND